MMVDFLPLGTADLFVETETIRPMLDVVGRKSGDPTLAARALRLHGSRQATIDTIFEFVPNQITRDMRREAVGCLVCTLHDAYLHVLAMYVKPHRLTPELLAKIQGRVEEHTGRLGYDRMRMQTSRAGDALAASQGYRQAAVVYEKRLASNRAAPTGP